MILLDMAVETLWDWKDCVEVAHSHLDANLNWTYILEFKSLRNTSMKHRSLVWSSNQVWWLVIASWCKMYFFTAMSYIWSSFLGFLISRFPSQDHTQKQFAGEMKCEEDLPRSGPSIM
jgi:hypothetical protein